MAPLLEIRHLTIDFSGSGKLERAVDDVSLTINPGEVLFLIGESGAGKTLTGLSIGGFVLDRQTSRVSGEVILQGNDVLKMSARELRGIRGRSVAYVFQEPRMSFNPVYSIGAHLKDALGIHRPDHSNDAEVFRLLSRVGLTDANVLAKRYPRELSSGMLQRVSIAVALACGAPLLVADEPTASLDVTVQAEVLRLLKSILNKTEKGMLFITHNLALVFEVVENPPVVVMHKGRVVECGLAREVFHRPAHPYTKALLQSALGIPCV